MQAPIEGELADADARVNAETWSDLIRMQAKGLYPTAVSPGRGVLAWPGPLH